MKTSIITVTYDKDLEFLKYNLKSIKKFCKGYHENIVVIDDHENDCVETQRYLDSIGQKYFINHEAKHIKAGYVRQQYMGYYMDKYCSPDTEYVCCVDTDNIFIKEHKPGEVYFSNDKPIMLMSRWENLAEKFHIWIKPTTEILKFRPDHEFMRVMPLVYPLWLFKEIRSYLEDVHKKPLLEILDVPLCAEYDIWGAYAYKYYKDKFHWVDEVLNYRENIDYRYHLPCIQYSNRPEAQPHRYVDLSHPDNPISQLFKDK